MHPLMYEGLKYRCITINSQYLPRSTGVLYGKSLPDVVKSVLVIDYHDEYLGFFPKVNDHFILDAQCENGAWMRGIKARVDRVEHFMRVGAQLYLTLFRKKPKS